MVVERCLGVWSCGIPFVQQLIAHLRVEADQVKFFVEECAGEEVDRIQKIEFSGVMEHAAVELDVGVDDVAGEELHTFISAFVAGVFDVFEGFALAFEQKITAGVGPFRAGFAESEGVEHREQVVFYVHPVVLRRIGAVQPVDVGFQHLGNRDFAEIALNRVQGTEQCFLLHIDHL